MIEVVRDFLYIGDLSREDADVLAHFSRRGKAILEFGVGGSTQIFAQCAANNATLVSVDTSVAWMSRTQEVLSALRINRRVEFRRYEDLVHISGRFDFIFDDGVPQYRLPFARHAWSRLLQSGGWMLFHDTRRPRHWEDVVQLLRGATSEVQQVLFNIHESNITALQKRDPLDYVDWNHSEQRTLWERGNPRQARPPDFRERLILRQLH